ncbi:hypothetical protein DYBT9275_04381 [Dyadobacter sp. CECT 9275]|uniref:Heparinase n=1 Tax=Dyadobacter helix TaxID=2822344 RepID=A0A916JGE9_9BACT|nr:heparinase II/III family protein [Dyadobacter sp. CECT 9275]CAG5008902.1 hypothetical protein DYBT9275_04381 [Dyadobacter sp. CECT 9275]
MVSGRIPSLYKIIFFAWLAGLCSQVLAQEVYAPTPAADLSKLKTGHPRILLLKGEEKRILDQVQKHPQWRAVHEAILHECDTILGLAPLTREMTGKRLLGAQECLRRVFQLSYAYRTTRNPAYLNRAENEMLSVARFSDWNPSHFLDTAEMTMAVAIGYDWLYHDLPAATKDTLRLALVEKGIRISFDSKYNRFVTSEHNWNQVCNSGMVFGALAIAEDEPELAQNIINRALQSVPKVMNASYKPDGAYPEGYAYWEYGTSFNVLLISALEKALGEDYGLSAMPGFLKTAAFILNITGPINEVHNWGDCGEKLAGFSPASFWFASKTGDNSVLFQQTQFMNTRKAPGQVTNRLLPAALIWGTQLDISRIKKPEKKVWIGQGTNPVGFMRTSWTNRNAIFIGFKAGTPDMSHGQMDVGSFVLDAYGERWAMDFGSQDYYSLERRGVRVFGHTQDAQRWQIFRYNNLVHNTLTINGQHQRVDGYAKIDNWSESSSRMSVISDISTVYRGQLQSAKRGISIIDNREVVIRDEVKAPDRNTTLRWTLLTPAHVKVLDKKTVELTQNGKTMYLIFDSELPISIKTWPTTPPKDYDAPNPGTALVGFEANIPAGTEQYFNTFFSKNRTGFPPIGKLDSWNGK